MTKQPTRAELEAALDQADTDYRAAAAEVAKGNSDAQKRMPALWIAIGRARDALLHHDTIDQEARRLAVEQRAAEEAQALRDAIAAGIAATEELPGLAVQMANQIDTLAATVNQAKVAQAIAVAGMRSARPDEVDSLRFSLGDFEQGAASLLGVALENLCRLNLQGLALQQSTHERETGRTWPQGVAAGCERAIRTLERQLPPEPKEAA